jgi:hypothetical protein
MNQEKADRIDARDERLAHALRTGEYIDQFTTTPTQFGLRRPRCCMEQNARRRQQEMRARQEIEHDVDR